MAKRRGVVSGEGAGLGREVQVKGAGPKRGAWFRGKRRGLREGTE